MASAPFDPLLGTRRSWIGDHAAVGAGCGLFFPFIGVGLAFGVLFPVACAVAGGAFGALVGALAFAMWRRKPSTPFVAILPLASVAGGLWGGLTGALGSFASQEVLPDWPTGVIFGFSGFIGALSGAGTLVVFWLPYLFMRLRGRSRAGIVIAALALPPIVWMVLVMGTGGWGGWTLAEGLLPIAMVRH